MKFGMRKPNIKKSLKAKTTGKIKRNMKKTVNPLYGKKGIGYIKNPNKAIYNKVYNKTSISAFKVFKKSNSFIYNILIAFPLFFIFIALEIIYYCYKYMFLGITWAIKKICRLIKKEEEDIL